MFEEVTLKLKVVGDKVLLGILSKGRASYKPWRMMALVEVWSPIKKECRAQGPGDSGVVLAGNS